MSDKSPKSVLGPVVFWISTAATLLFFWWLLIYDHGIPAAHY